MNNVDVKIKVLNEGCLPIYQHKTDVCADCFANIDHEIILRAHLSVAIPLGFKLQLPANWKAVILSTFWTCKKKRDCMFSWRN